MLTHEYPPYSNGGVGTFCAELADALGSKSIDVTIATGSPVRPLRHDRQDHVNVLRMPRVDIPPNWLWFQLMNQNAFKRILREVDVVHGHDTSSFPTIYLTKRNVFKIPWAITVHGCPVSEMNYTIHSIRNGGSIREFVSCALGFPVWDSVLRGDLKFADKIIPVSNCLYEEMKASKYKPQNQLVTIHPGVNIQRLIQTASCGIAPPVAKSLRMFWSGRHVWRKGILQLLQSLQILKQRLRFDNFELNIFGHGPLDRAILQSVIRRGLERNVKFRGFVAYDRLLAWLASSDIVCFPSLSEYLPTALIEAMALGKPVAAFDKPFARETMGEQVNLPLAKSIEQLASNLHELCVDEDLRRTMGMHLQQRARTEFDIHIAADKYAKVYSSLVSC